MKPDRILPALTRKQPRIGNGNFVIPRRHLEKMHSPCFALLCPVDLDSRSKETLNERRRGMRYCDFDARGLVVIVVVHNASQLYRERSFSLVAAVYDEGALRYDNADEIPPAQANLSAPWVQAKKEGFFAALRMTTKGKTQAMKTPRLRNRGLRDRAVRERMRSIGIECEPRSRAAPDHERARVVRTRASAAAVKCRGRRRNSGRAELFCKLICVGIF